MDQHDDTPLIMGILNVTPDSFSDGGNYATVESAVAHALTMVGDGADIIDVGGESSRPGAKRVPAAQQIQRVVPVIRALRERLPETVAISIDTTLFEVAEAAADAGAGIINDISAGTEDSRIFPLAGERDLPVVIMHLPGDPETMQQNPEYDDVVEDVLDYLVLRAEAAQNAGMTAHRIIIDPGIGFGKTREHNLMLMANLHRFVDTGFDVLLGASRKRFMGSVCRDSDPVNLLGATCAATALGVESGVRIFRVHDVRANRQAADVAWAIAQYYEE